MGGNQKSHEQQTSTRGNCSRCAEPLSNKVNYCIRCGKVAEITLFWDDTGRAHYCVNHPQTQIELGCGLCGDAICPECYTEKMYPFASSVPIPICPTCATTSKLLESAYIAERQRSGYCPNHTNQRAQHSCSNCGAVLCLDCVYFTKRGLFRVKIDKGPFCIACLRKHDPKHGFNLLSARKAIAAGML